MHPEKGHFVRKRKEDDADHLVILAMCEVCSEPMVFTEDDAVFMIENDFIQCGYCKQLNPITDELKSAILDIC